MHNASHAAICCTSANRENWTSTTFCSDKKQENIKSFTNKEWDRGDSDSDWPSLNVELKIFKSHFQHIKYDAYFLIKWFYQHSHCPNNSLVVKSSKQVDKVLFKKLKLIGSGSYIIRAVFAPTHKTLILAVSFKPTNMLVSDHQSINQRSQRAGLATLSFLMLY